MKKWENDFDNKYKYDILIKVRGEWESYGQASIHSGTLASEITEEVYGCEAVRYIDRNTKEVYTY